MKLTEYEKVIIRECLEEKQQDTVSILNRISPNTTASKEVQHYLKSLLKLKDKLQ